MLEKAVVAKINKLINAVCDVAIEQAAKNEFPKENIEAIARLIEATNTVSTGGAAAIGFTAEHEESDDG